MAPYFWLVTHHIAWNHRRSDFRVRWKSVPAVTEVSSPHPRQSVSPLPFRQVCRASQRGHVKPPGQRTAARYASHASSVPNRWSNSTRFRG